MSLIRKQSIWTTEGKKALVSPFIHSLSMSAFVRAFAWCSETFALFPMDRDTKIATLLKDGKPALSVHSATTDVKDGSGK